MTHVIRLGTHAEKDYFERARPWYDEVLLNANLVEATAGATSLFVFQLNKPYFIEPVTYAFALDPLYIQSPDADKKMRFKRTFKKLAFHYGITQNDDQDPPRLSVDYFSDAGRTRQFCDRVLAYQRDKCDEALQENQEFLLEAPVTLRPVRLVAPYFYSAHDPMWREVNGRLVEESSGLAGDLPLWAVICMDALVLDDEEVVDEVADFYAQLPCTGIGLWLTDLEESSATATQLRGVRRLVSKLVESGKQEIVNLYGGYFSALLRFDGLTGLSHGVGYGERRNVVPVVGGGLPPAKYYLPRIHEKIYLEELLRLASGLDAQQFLDEICECSICSGLVGVSLEYLLNEYSRTVRKPFRGGYRDYADPIVYRYTRFHFLHNRHLELAALYGMTLEDAVAQLDKAREDFGARLSTNQVQFLQSWAKALTTAID